MTRVLHIFGSLRRAGAQTFVMNVYRVLDRTRIQFDFIVSDKTNGGYEEEIQQLGGRIFFVPSKKKSVSKNFLSIRRIVAENGYGIVHRHTNNSSIVLDLLASRMGGASVLIAHSHSTNSNYKYINYLFRPLLNKVSTGKFACSEEAGSWLFGNKDFDVIRNCINSASYKYELQNRIDIRKKLSIDDNEFVVGHVGRLDSVKNQIFLIDVFRELVRINPTSKLLLIGDGTLREEIIRKISNHELSEHVILLGTVENVSHYLQAMDIFVLPSLHEGLPMTLIEAQATGLVSLVSAIITREANITGLVNYLSLDKGAKEWALEISSIKSFRREDMYCRIMESGYDVQDLAHSLGCYYLNAPNSVGKKAHANT